jgi:hypothetical protein
MGDGNMNWREVIASLETTVYGAERAAKLAENLNDKLEARIVAGVAAAFAGALRQGLGGSHD